MTIDTKALRMDAYYYSFYNTGAPEIDLLLSAVACAGKAYHYTVQWNDETKPYPGHEGGAPVEWIQNAAKKAADRLAALEAELADEKADRELWVGRALKDQTARQECQRKSDALEAENQRLREVMRSTGDSLHIMARRGTAKDPGVMVCALNLRESLATGGDK